MTEILVYVAFVLLIAIPTAILLPTIPDRLADLRAGAIGIVYVPLLWLLLFPIAAAAFWVAQFVPILEWGWLGSNIAVTPLLDVGSPSDGGGTVESGQSVLRLLYVMAFIPLILLAFLLFNYHEEDGIYRDSYPRVFGWATLHLIMGIPIVAIIPIFAVGCGFKVIYDHRGQNVAYAAHFASNCGILGLLVIAVILGAV